MLYPIFPLILSGGTGSRLWPISRESHPKPFLTLQDGETLLQKTFKRAMNLQSKHIITLTNKAYFLKSKIEFEKEASSHLNLSYLLEPCARNTSAALALAAIKIARTNGADAILLVLPADHLIQDIHSFTLACQKAFEIAKDNKIVTFGVRPSYAETGYGYIECDTQGKVKAFIEKPNLNVALSLIATKRHFWNSGMFCFKASVILEEFEKFEPHLLKDATHCYETSLAQNTDPAIFTFDENSFVNIKSISLDYAIMEKSQRIAMIPCEFDWEDIGSWEAYKKLHPANKDGNTLMGNAVTIDSYNNLIQSDNRIIALIGIKNLTIVDTPDALLISHREKVQEVKQVTELLKAQAHQSYLVHRTISRPWGTYTILEENPAFKIKRVCINPFATLSLHLHQFRNEHWVVISGTAKIQKEDQEYLLSSNESTFIPTGIPHRLSNPHATPLIIIEVQAGSYVGEDDMIRLENEFETHENSNYL